jgi:hypothetical protein
MSDTKIQYGNIQFQKGNDVEVTEKYHYISNRVAALKKLNTVNISRSWENIHIRRNRHFCKMSSIDYSLDNRNHDH